MIKSVLLFAIGLLFSSALMAQVQQSTTTIRLILSDVLYVEPGSAANNGEIDFNYSSVEDYNSEKTAFVPNSLVITFSKPFDIKVKANGANFENGVNNIPVDVMTIRRNQSSSMGGNSTPIVLSTEDQVLVNDVNLGFGLKLDLDYIIPASKSSSTDILGKPAGTYTQTITYTATAL